jgi:replicative DNA helicase
MKQMAKELQCPVISATQLNEAGQSRESRAIEQDADAALYIADDGIKVVKLRNGVRNDLLPLYLNGALQRFQDVKLQD